MEIGDQGGADDCMDGFAAGRWMAKELIAFAIMELGNKLQRNGYV